MKTVIVGTNTLLQMAKQLKDRGEITKQQYLDMKRNNEGVNKEHKLNKVIIQ